MNTSISNYAVPRNALIALIVLLGIRPLSTIADEDHGIRFESAMNWQRVVKKAQLERKHIFVDIYATWCKPCKKMEETVFTQKMVGDHFNPRFISVRVQSDTTDNDGDAVKRWRADAQALVQHYDVKALPMFLFFSPGGRLVARHTGAATAEKIVTVAADALNYEQVIAHYRIDDQQLPVPKDRLQRLARQARDVGDVDVARRIADEYLDSLQEEDLLTRPGAKENIVFMGEFMESSKDRGFAFFYQHTNAINRIMGRSRAAEEMLEYIIATEDIQAVYGASVDPLKSPDPDWSEITAAITQKYNAAYANRTVGNAKMYWYNASRKLSKLASSTVEYVQRFGSLMGWNELNTHAWTVFSTSNDKQELEIALSWVEQARSMPGGENDIGTTDTYANLLYKLGRVDEAIPAEERALVLARKAQQDQMVKVYEGNLEKMKKGVPTWPQQ